MLACCFLTENVTEKHVELLCYRCVYEFFVSLHAVELRESLATDVTNKRLPSRVYLSMSIERIHFYKALPTDIAFVWSLRSMV